MSLTVVIAAILLISHMAAPTIYSVLSFYSLLACYIYSPVSNGSLSCTVLFTGGVMQDGVGLGFNSLL